MRLIASLILLIFSAPLSEQSWALTKSVDHDYSFEFTAWPTAHNSAVLIDAYHPTIYQGRDHSQQDTALYNILKADRFAPSYLYQAISPKTLSQDTKLLVIVGMRRAGKPRIRKAEIQHVYNWVINGGSLLLIVGHYPNGKALYPLLQMMGVNYQPDFAYKAGLVGEKTDAKCSHFRLVEKYHLNKQHPILQRSTHSLPISQVDFLCGMAISRNREDVVLQLPAGTLSIIHDRTTGRIREVPHQHLMAGMLGFQLGQGKVVVASDQGLFRHLWKDFQGQKLAVTMNNPSNQNAELLLNTLRWLADLD